MVFCLHPYVTFCDFTDNNKIAKIHDKIFKILFSRTTEPISTKLGPEHPWVRGIQVFSNEKTENFYKVNNVLFLLFIIICVY